MNSAIQILYPAILICGIIVVGLAIFYRIKFYVSSYYTFAFAGLIKKHGYDAGLWRGRLLNILRVLSLFLLVAAASRPQSATSDTPLEVEGIDIILALDVSGSMITFDDIQDQRTRISVAKSEAITFVKKRDHDQIGLVLFAHESLARLPLSLDKRPLLEVLEKLEIGVIDPNATLMMTGMITGISRLARSKAKSKILIVLTDGIPHEQEMHLQKHVVDLAKKIGVKIYTIGIGGPDGVSYYRDPIMGIQQIYSPLNEELLKYFARETGGKYFAAAKPEDLKRIYQSIDALEKSTIKTPVYTDYYELGIPLMLIAALLLLVELFLRHIFWRML